MARILHVEDQGHWSDLIRRALADHTVDCASSHDEALGYLFAGNSYDLALVDLHLIGDDDFLGGEVLDLLRTGYPGTRRIVVTGSPPMGSLRANIFERYGVEEIIIKGQSTLPDLRRVVEGALSRAADELPQDVKMRRSELRQRYYEWQRMHLSVLDRNLRDAEDYVRNAGRLHAQSRRRAEEARDAALAAKEEFDEVCKRTERLVHAIRDRRMADLAMDELGRLEALSTDELGASSASEVEGE